MLWASGLSPNEANDRFSKRTHWQARENGSHKRATSPANRFRQTNPLTRFDVLSSEKCRCPGRVGFPRTKPIWVRGGRFPERSQGVLGSTDQVVFKKSRWDGLPGSCARRLGLLDR